MAGRPLRRPRHWSVVRVAQPSHRQEQSLIRAYELAVPILHAKPINKPVPKGSATHRSHRRHSPILLGA
jgi:hypothetical protein